ncbi:energy transducer TonB [Archangium minus]|uniref:Energy transducer TonB n=1 Tax=Archangium minus TaxID=83450 RepID=A0ABY9WSD8_9BACT|nr:energy transducer TonB [Archangium minus]
MLRPEPPSQSATSAESIASIVFGPAKARRPGRLVWAVVVTASLHGAAGVLAWRAWQNGEAHTPPVVAKPPIRIDHVVELKPPAPVEPPPPPTPPPAAPRPQQRVARADSPPSRAKSTKAPAPAPAQAGQVVAVDAAEAPLDFTGFDIVSGQGSSYAGGVTASNGTSERAVEEVASSQGDDKGSGTGKARPVQLPARNWDCPWPQEADALRISEQTVVMRVVVTPEGRVTSAELVSDPGNGFGEAALACARSARFDAALDREGRPYLATSPPIRVRFKRR